MRSRVKPPSWGYVNESKFVVKADSMDDLVLLGTPHPAGKALPGAAVASGLNVLVTGGTAGKGI